MPSAPLEFFFDYGSPYSYLADTQIPALIERTGAELVYRPILLGGVFKSTGNRSPFNEPVDAKRRYFSAEMKRVVEHLGVGFESNPHFPVNTLGLMRAAFAASHLGVFEAFHGVVYRAFWTGGAALGEPEVIERVLCEGGLDGKAIVAAAQEAPAKTALREATDAAVARGVFGAPTFFVGDEMFFGCDRLEYVEREIERTSQSASE